MVKFEEQEAVPFESFREKRGRPRGRPRAQSVRAYEASITNAAKAREVKAAKAAAKLHSPDAEFVDATRQVLTATARFVVGILEDPEFRAATLLFIEVIGRHAERSGHRD